MKKIHAVRLGLSALCLFLLLSSCKKDYNEKSSSPDQSSNSQLSIIEAKKWYQNKMQTINSNRKTQSISTNGTETLAGYAFWEKSVIHTVNMGSRTADNIAVPILSNYLAEESHKTIIERVVFFKNQDGKIDGRIIRIIPDILYASTHSNGYKKEDFEGYVMQFDFDDKFVFGYRLDKGKANYNVGYLVRESSAGTSFKATTANKASGYKVMSVGDQITFNGACFIEGAPVKLQNGGTAIPYSLYHFGACDQVVSAPDNTYGWGVGGGYSGGFGGGTGSGGPSGSGDNSGGTNGGSGTGGTGTSTTGTTGGGRGGTNYNDDGSTRDPSYNGPDYVSDLPGDMYGNGGTAENGFLKLNLLVIQNRMALMGKCVDIAPWIPLAQKMPNAQANAQLMSINDHLNEFNNSVKYLSPDLMYGPTDVQSIFNASGAQVNLDYFSIVVQKLPAGFASPNAFLTYIRKEINEFSEGSSFSPFPATPFLNQSDNSAIWNSDNPSGALVHIAIPGNHGTVIVSDANDNSWTFTTINSYLDDSHPVSGNRQFGFFQNPDASYTFYTQGADRITDEFTSFVQHTTGIPFSKADELWKSFQNRVSSYVNNHSGIAFINAPVIFRPNYDLVRSVLTGATPLSTITDQNCNQVKN